MAASRNLRFFPTAIVLSMCFISVPTIKALDFGIKAGVSASDQSYNYSVPGFRVDRLYQTATAAGIFISSSLGSFSSFRFEVDYVQKGSALEVDLTTPQSPAVIGRLRFEDQIDYLSFNLLATPTLSISPIVSPYLIFGPRADILVGTSSAFSSLVLDDLNAAVFGGTIGIGFSILLKSSASLLFEGVYNYDFTYAYDKDVLKIKNNSALFTTGLSF